MTDEHEEEKEEKDEDKTEEHADAHGHGGHGGHGHAPAKSAKPAANASSKKVLSILELFVDPLMAHVRASIVKTSRFVTFAIGLFFLGTLFGFFLPQLAGRVGIDASTLLMVPLILAILAFFPAFTDAILVVFILLLLALLFTIL